MDTFYLGIGAPRSGTTWLYNNLRRTTDLYLPPVKELRFFEAQRAEGHKHAQIANLLNAPQRDPRDPAFIDAWKRTKDGTAEHYLGLFPAEGKVGEISPIYCTLPLRKAKAVKAALGGRPTKVFMLLRNPYMRDISHLVFSMHKQRDRSALYETAEYMEHVQRLKFRQRSNYTRTVSIWSKVFGDDFHLYYYDDLLADPELFFRNFVSDMNLEVSTDGFNASKTNQSGSKGRFRVDLPIEVRKYLRRRHLRTVKTMEFLPEARRAAWLDEIKAVKLTAPGTETQRVVQSS